MDSDNLIRFICLLLHASLVIGQNGHPLDPLSAAEITETVQILETAKPILLLQNTWYYRSIALLEPEKSLLLDSFLTGNSPPTTIARKSRAIIVEQQTNVAYVAIVNLTSKLVESWKQLDSSFNTGVTDEEHALGLSITKNDARVQERCREMGWTNMSLVVVDYWSLAYVDDIPELANAIKPALMFLYGQVFPEDNHYAHPFDFYVNVDIGARQVLSIGNLPTHDDYGSDNRTGNICPLKLFNYRASINPNITLRSVNPIHFSQPLGAGYTISGNEISWQKFKFRVGFHPAEGLTIHHVTYQDGETLRPLFYRLSVAELFVPYGDVRSPYYQKFVFDMGEFWLGYCTVNIEKAGLCTGGGVPSYFTFHLNTDQGEPTSYPSVICIHEEDTGLLWAHTTLEGPIIHTRSQRLAVTTIVSVDNYDYKFSWHFYQDARIEFETELHGILNSQLLAVNLTNTGGFGTRVAPDINAQYHQHFVVLRIDPEIDGNSNAVSTVDIFPHPENSGSAGNPYGNGFITQSTILQSPEQAKTKISPGTGRTWLLTNPNKMHPATTKPVGWKLLPFNAPQLMIKPDSPMHSRVSFADYNVWVTKYREGQFFPMGEFNEDGKGLEEWAEDYRDDDLNNTDVVLWYILGFTHIPRAEDWPIMPLETAGFAMKPTNFFETNPALDVPSFE